MTRQDENLQLIHVLMSIIPIGIIITLSLVWFMCSVCYNIFSCRGSSEEVQPLINQPQVNPAPVAPVDIRVELAQLLEDCTPRSNASSFDVLNESFGYGEESLEDSEGNRSDLERTFRAPRDSPSLPVSPPLARLLGNTPNSNTSSVDVIDEASGYGQGPLGNSDGERSDSDGTFKAPKASSSQPVSSESSGTSSGTCTPQFSISLSDDSDREQRKKIKEQARRMRDQRRLHKERVRDEVALLRARAKRPLRGLKKKREETQGGVDIPYTGEVGRARRSAELEREMSQEFREMPSGEMMARFGAGNSGFVPPGRRAGAGVDLGVEFGMTEGDELVEGRVGGGAGPKATSQVNVADGASQIMAEHGAVLTRPEVTAMAEGAGVHHQLVLQNHGVVAQRPEATAMGEGAGVHHQLGLQHHGAVAQRPEETAMAEGAGVHHQLIFQHHGAVVQVPEATAMSEGAGVHQQLVLHHHGALPTIPEVTAMAEESGVHQQLVLQHHGAVVQGQEATAAKGFTFLEWYDELRPPRLTNPEAGGDLSQPLSRPVADCGLVGCLPLPAFGALDTERRVVRPVAPVAPRGICPEVARAVYVTQMRIRREMERAVGRNVREGRPGELNQAVQDMMMLELIQQAENRAREVPPAVENATSPDDEEVLVDINQKHYI